jgi:8-amino-7-oxononanoate synthase
MPLDDYLFQSLKKRKEEGLFRQLKTTSPAIDFCSNDYLGLGRSSELYEQIQKRASLLFPKRNGASGSRLLSGNSDYTEQVERKLANIFLSESALIFNSGYTANLAVLSSIPQRGDTILYDELAHACIKDGARLSLANRFSFFHNDLNDLEKKLKRSTGRKFIAVESIYSMDGDEALLKDIVHLSEKYEATIILDEAHSTGVIGEKGSGLATALSLHQKIDIRVYTFGKGMGIHGACVCGSVNLRDYLINFSRPFIYTTALSPHEMCAIECAFDFLGENISLQSELQQKISYYQTLTRSVTNKTTSNSAIQTILVPGNDNVKKVANNLQAQGFDIRPIMSPTVQKNTERLRICLHTYNTLNELTALSQALTKLHAHH